MIIEVQVTPNAKKNEFMELKPGFYRVKTTARAIGGKANLAVIDILSENLGIARSRLSIKTGEKSKIKLIEIF